MEFFPEKANETTQERDRDTLKTCLSFFIFFFASLVLIVSVSILITIHSKTLHNILRMMENDFVEETERKKNMIEGENKKRENLVSSSSKKGKKTKDDDDL